MAAPGRSAQRRETLAGYGFLTPVLLGLLFWTLIPMVLSLYYSFTRYDLPHSPHFNGGSNYTALFGDPTFYNSLKVTVIFAVVSVPLSLLIGLLIAVMLNQRVPGMRIFRTLIYLPSLIPLVASAVVFKTMLSPSNFGLVNYVLMKLHIISTPIEFFTSPSTALWSVIFMGMWGAGGSMLVWLAGLQSVPDDLYEASRVDGAGAVRRFFSITLPIISPTILFNAVLGIIGSLQVFVQSLVITAGSTGAPLGSLDFIDVFIYRHAFGYLQMGYGAATAWVLFAIVLIVTLAFFRWSRRWVFYQGGER
ncbi:MAG TPA: sugar ABC transporter permease [Mycobacteriales bacterium]|nr:sugar ABC transporter permease [Mycobacteriales bacterium]